MKYFSILVILIACISVGQAQSELTVQVTNIKAIKGKVLICVVDEKADFLKNCKYSSMATVEGSEVSVVIKDVEDGEYAISIFHDKNNDDKLNTNFVGIPKEPYGFSNNPFAMFGPPSFEKCLFAVNANTSVSIKL